MPKMKEKKGFNWKARQVVTTEIRETGTDKIELDPEYHDARKTDANNLLVLPSKKRKTKTIKKSNSVIRILSKKQRKELQKVVERKKKKENRALVLTELSSASAPAEITKCLPSISAFYSKSKKSRKQNASTKSRERADDELEDEEDSDEATTEDPEPEREGKRKLSSVKGSNKRHKLLSSGIPSTKESLPANTITFESSSDDGSDGESSDGAGGGASDKPAEEQSVETPPPAADEGKEEEGERGAEARPDRTPAVYVHVERSPAVQEARLKLPVLAEEQAVMEAVRENPVVLLAGETGSGKTTQVPQFLYEAGYARDGRMIGVTEPRRVAAIAMSSRVAHEMNLSSREVSYLIRFEGNATEDTKIKFMTDGVLLKEIQCDFLLSRYSAVVLDEAHERTVHTDILVGLLSRISLLRARRGDPLKLVVMSATLRLEDFTANRRLFKTPPPVIKVEGRQFPVTVHFSKRTDPDYVSAAFRKACRIHTQLPAGGILIFLTGQQEVNSVVKKLNKTFPLRGSRAGAEGVDDGEDDGARRKKKMKRKEKKARRRVIPEVKLDDYPAGPPQPDEEEGEGYGSEEGSDRDDDVAEASEWLGPPASRQPVWALPLYSLLPSAKQTEVFKPVPDGCRLCVVATNVAETSLTIPNVKYVVDSGRVKAKLYDGLTGVSMFAVKWTSKASADQRAGRAGRMGPGHCYRLFSSAVFNDQFEAFEVPEIQRKPVDDLVLQMKAMNIHKVVNFPFPTPIDPVQLRSAERRLTLLGALEKQQLKGKAGEFSSRLTPLGRSMAVFPVAPRFAKMLALGHQHGLLPYVVCAVAALSVQEVLAPSDKQSADRRRRWAGTGNSFQLGDVMVLMGAIGAAEYANSQGRLEEFCRASGLRPKAVAEVRKLRRQLCSEVNASVPGLQLAVDPAMEPPSDRQALLLRQTVLSGLVDQVARRVPPGEVKDDQDKLKWKRAYRCEGVEDPAFLHPSSVLFRSCPDWVVYQETFETSKQYLRGVTAIEPQWLPTFAPGLCSLSPPLAEPPPRFSPEDGEVLCHVSGTFGRSAWELPVVEVPFPPGPDAYKWFATFLLDGSVCPALQRFRKQLLSSPATMVKTWANLQPRTSALLNALTARQVRSRGRLLEAWQKDRLYLLSEVQQWLPESAHSDLAATWPPV
ncbi:probable ATP-dependent RNA helicase kurz [Bacillus rossius redtenbacheri]|uniref:probable ATP-dependent RNA helicase kurz n=1 Tax=Bacillus rossius redtenbacheri TaxID=93214 RepID=UPI002FDEEAE3